MNSPATPSDFPAAPVPRTRTWLAWGARVFLVVEAVHIAVGVRVNEWEGWDNFWENLSFVVVSGLIVVGLVYGLLVRWGLNKAEAPGNRPSAAAMWTGILSLFSYGAFFVWAPFLIAPGAVLLAREGITRARATGLGRSRAVVGGALGTLSLAFGVFSIGFLLMRGVYPWSI